MNNPLHPLDAGIIGLYLLLLVGIGLTHSRGSRRNQDNFILAGRRLSLPGFVATLVATWYGGILGIGENTYTYGLQTWFIFGLPYYVFAILFALFLSRRIRSMTFISIPDHFARSYGRPAAILSAVLLLFLSSPAPYILSLGILIRFLFGFELGWAILSATVFSLLYIWFGGFGAVVRTDIFQFALMFAGFFLLLSFAWKQVGSPLQMLAALPAGHLRPSGGHSLQFMAVWFFLALWTFVDPGFYQRCAAARTPGTARRGILMAVLFWFVFDFLTLSTGLYATVALEHPNALFAYPLLGALILPPVVYGLFMTGLLATVMSTIDSQGLISAVTFGRDILWRLRRTGSDPDSTRLTQWGLPVMAGIALLLAWKFPSVVQLWYVIGSIMVPGLLLPFLGSFTRLTLPPGPALAWMTVPTLVALGWFLAGHISGNYPLGLEPFYPGILVSVLLSALLPYLHRRRTT